MLVGSIARPPAVNCLMIIPPNRRELALSSAILLIGAIACSDSTSPGRHSHTLAGTYALSTVLDSLTYTDDCVNPPSNGVPPVCHETTVVNAVGTMKGTVVFGDTIPGTIADLLLPITSAALRVGECGTSCSPSVAQYSVIPATVSRTGKDSLEFAATMTGPAWIDFDGWITGDSLSGQITVITSVNCCTWRYYTGTFVMKRLPR